MNTDLNQIEQNNHRVFLGQVLLTCLEIAGCKSSIGILNQKRNQKSHFENITFKASANKPIDLESMCFAYYKYDQVGYVGLFKELKERAKEKQTQANNLDKYYELSTSILALFVVLFTVAVALYFSDILEGYSNLILGSAGGGLAISAVSSALLNKGKNTKEDDSKIINQSIDVLQTESLKTGGSVIFDDITIEREYLKSCLSKLTSDREEEKKQNPTRNSHNIGRI